MNSRFAIHGNVLANLHCDEVSHSRAFGAIPQEARHTRCARYSMPLDSRDYAALRDGLAAVGGGVLAFLWWRHRSRRVRAARLESEPEAAAEEAYEEAYEATEKTEETEENQEREPLHEMPWWRRNAALSAILNAGFGIFFVRGEWDTPKGVPTTGPTMIILSSLVAAAAAAFIAMSPRKSAAARWARWLVLAHGVAKLGLGIWVVYTVGLPLLVLAFFMIQPFVLLAFFMKIGPAVLTPVVSMVSDILVFFYYGCGDSVGGDGGGEGGADGPGAGGPPDPLVLLGFIVGFPCLLLLISCVC